MVDLSLSWDKGSNMFTNSKRNNGTTRLTILVLGDHDVPVDESMHESWPECWITVGIFSFKKYKDLN